MSQVSGCIEKIDEIIKKVNEANDLFKEVVEDDLYELNLCSGSFTDRIHVFNGIELLAEHYNAELLVKPEYTWEGHVYQEHYFYVGSVKVFQLTKPKGGN